MSKTLVIFALLLTAALPASAQKVLAGNSMPAPTAPNSPPAIHALQISAGDLLDLSVFDTPELSTKLRVDEQGKVTLPVAGSILSRLGPSASHSPATQCRASCAVDIENVSSNDRYTKEPFSSEGCVRRHAPRDRANEPHCRLRPPATQPGQNPLRASLRALPACRVLARTGNLFLAPRWQA